MKDLPNYKWVDILQWTDLKQPKILKEINNLKNPIILNLSNLSPIAPEKLYMLEEELLKNVRSIYYPYPIYILGHSPHYSGRLHFFTNKKNPPHFYPDRPKSTSKIHSELIHYNQIAQREFECINYKKADETIANYAQIQKKIHLAYSELQALRYIAAKASIENKEEEG